MKVETLERTDPKAKRYIFTFHSYSLDYLDTYNNRSHFAQFLTKAEAFKKEEHIVVPNSRELPYGCVLDYVHKHNLKWFQAVSNIHKATITIYKGPYMFVKASAEKEKLYKKFKALCKEYNGENAMLYCPDPVTHSKIHYFFTYKKDDGTYLMYISDKPYSIKLKTEDLL